MKTSSEFIQTPESRMKLNATILSQFIVGNYASTVSLDRTKFTETVFTPEIDTGVVFKYSEGELKLGLPVSLVDLPHEELTKINGCMVAVLRKRTGTKPFIELNIIEEGKSVLVKDIPMIPRVQDRNAFVGTVEYMQIKFPIYFLE